MAGELTRDTLLEAARPSNTTIGVLAFGERYALIRQTNGIPLCTFAAASDFERAKLRLPDPESDRVLLLPSDVTDVAVYSASHLDECVKRQTSTRGVTTLSVILDGVAVHEDQEQKAVHPLVLTEEDMLRIMYGHDSTLPSGIISFAGAPREEDMAIVLTKEVRGPEKTSTHKATDVLFVTPDSGNSSIDGAMQLLEAMSIGFRSLFMDHPTRGQGIYPELRDMWQVLDAIESIPAVRPFEERQKKLVIAHLLAQQIMMIRGILPTTEPEWRQLQRSVASLPHRFERIFRGDQVARANRQKEMQRFVSDTVQRLLVDDVAADGVTDETVQAGEAATTESFQRGDLRAELKTKEIQDAFSLTIGLLQKAYDDVGHLGKESLVEAKKTILNEIEETLRRKLQTVFSRNFGDVTDRDLDLLGDIRLVYDWFNTKQIDWWTAKGDVWFEYQWEAEEAGLRYIQGRYTISKPYQYSGDGTSPTSVKRSELSRQISIAINDRIAKVHTDRYRTAAQGGIK